MGLARFRPPLSPLPTLFLGCKDCLPFCMYLPQSTHSFTSLLHTCKAGSSGSEPDSGFGIASQLLCSIASRPVTHADWVHSWMRQEHAQYIKFVPLHLSRNLSVLRPGGRFQHLPATSAYPFASNLPLKLEWNTPNAAVGYIHWADTLFNHTYVRVATSFACPSAHCQHLLQRDGGGGSEASAFPCSAVPGTSRTTQFYWISVFVCTESFEHINPTSIHNSAAAFVTSRAFNKPPKLCAAISSDSQAVVRCP